MDYELVDANEGARVTGLRPQTIYRLARQGRIRSVRVLRRARRFNRADLVGLIRATDEPAESNTQSK